MILEDEMKECNICSRRKCNIDNTLRQMRKNRRYNPNLNENCGAVMPPSPIKVSMLERLAYKDMDVVGQLLSNLGLKLVETVNRPYFIIVLDN